MVATAFDALSDDRAGARGAAGDGRRSWAARRVRMGTLRAINLRLTRMRRRLGPQRGIFERIGEEIGQVEGLIADNEQLLRAQSTSSSTG